MNWYQWNSQQEFNNWHKALCEQLGYPLVSANQATGELDQTAVMTTAYTTSHEVGGKIIADVALEYADGLTPTELRPATR